MAYHSTRPGSTEPYHLYNDCVDGNNIEPRYRVEGQGTGKLCHRCAERTPFGALQRLLAEAPAPAKPRNVQAEAALKALQNFWQR